MKMSPWLVKQTVIIKLVKNVRKGNWEIKKKKKGVVFIKFPDQRQAKKVMLKVRSYSPWKGGQRAKWG